jgi:hypothetical protein
VGAAAATAALLTEDGPTIKELAEARILNCSAAAACRRRTRA